MTRHRLLVFVVSTIVLGATIRTWAENAPKPGANPTFALSQRTLDLTPKLRTAVFEALNKSFGDLSNPRVPEGFPIEPTVSNGRAVFLMHCVRCHGSRGDGFGTEGRSLEPKPRDFRLGIFKWKSTRNFESALRHDLHETLRLGVPKTGMPSFAELPEAERNSVVEYVRWLGMAGEFDSRLSSELSSEFSKDQIQERRQRGETERQIADDVDKTLKNDFDTCVSEHLSFISQRRTQSEVESSIVRPKVPATASSAESIERGQKLFQSDRTKCNSCHGTEGKGDGPATKEVWPVPGTIRKSTKPGLLDAWGQMNQPWDLTIGVYRGGDSPDDLFRRISAGISGTAMPAYSVVLKDVEIWDLVNFLQSIRPENLRGQSSNPRRSPPVGADP